jgi:tetratricopeptide (TPR) repeat protein
MHGTDAATDLGRMSIRASLSTWLFACSFLAAANGCTRAARMERESGTTLAARARADSDVPGRELFDRGMALAANADYSGAEHALAEALSAGYPAARLLPQLVEVCRKADRLSVGVDYATPYLRLHPGDYTLRYRVAELLFALGRYDTVRSELDRVIEVAPNYGPAHFLLAVTLRDHFSDANAAAEHLAVYHRLNVRSERRTGPALRTEPFAL